jgi:(-)-germacrene D synthase
LGYVDLFGRWWKDNDIVGKLPYVRDRVVEGYFWILSVYFEPQYSRARIIMAKMLGLFSIIDDTYDAYGTLEELQLFTDAIQRFDISTLNMPIREKLEHYQCYLVTSHA